MRGFSPRIFGLRSSDYRWPIYFPSHNRKATQLTISSWHPFSEITVTDRDKFSKRKMWAMLLPTSDFQKTQNPTDGLNAKSQNIY